MQQTLATLTEEYSQEEREAILEEVFERQAAAGSNLGAMRHHEDGEIPWYVGASEETTRTTVVDAAHGIHSLLGTTAGPENTVTAVDGSAQVLGIVPDAENPKPAGRPSALAKFVAGTAEGKMLSMGDLLPGNDALATLRSLLAAADGNA